MFKINKILIVVFVFLIVAITGEIMFYFFYSPNYSSIKKSTNIFLDANCFFSKNLNIDNCLSNSEKKDIILYYISKRQGNLISSQRVDRLRGKLLNINIANDGKILNFDFQEKDRTKKFFFDYTKEKEPKLFKKQGKLEIPTTINELSVGNIIELEIVTDLLSVNSIITKIVKL
jgi:hypothetical protein